MSPSREAVERVLLKHLSGERISLGGIPATASWFIPPELITDLLALATAPSREELTKLLWDNAPPPPTMKGDFTRALEKLEERVWAWATGVQERRWCEHIAWNVVSYPEGKWKLHDAGWMRCDELDRWKFCPVCGQKRPKELELG